MSDDALSAALQNLRRTLGVPAADPMTAGLDDTRRLACWMLVATRPWPAEADDVMTALLAAHRGGAEKEDAVEWRRLRRAAVALGDSSDPELHAYGMVAEAAAWPLSSAEAGLVELMRAVCQLRGLQASRATGWTPADEATAQAALAAIAEDERNGAGRPAREEIPALFMQADAVLERRFSTSLAAANAAYGAFRLEVVAWLAGAG